MSKILEPNALLTAISVSWFLLFIAEMHRTAANSVETVSIENTEKNRKPRTCCAFLCHLLGEVHFEVKIDPK